VERSGANLGLELLFAVGTMLSLVFFSAADLLSCGTHFLERIAN
jgi:hypothetical protein